MQRRYFEHVYTELSVAAGRRISRYDLWLQVWEAGGDPDALTRDEVAAFIGENLHPLLSEEGIQLAPGAIRRLKKRLLGFDPRHPTPEEWLEAAFGGASGSA